MLADAKRKEVAAAASAISADAQRKESSGSVCASRGDVVVEELGSDEEDGVVGRIEEDDSKQMTENTPEVRTEVCLCVQYPSFPLYTYVLYISLLSNLSFPGSDVSGDRAAEKGEGRPRASQRTEGEGLRAGAQRGRRGSSQERRGDGRAVRVSHACVIPPSTGMIHYV